MSILQNYGSCLPTLAARLLETQTLGLFYYPRLIPDLQDGVPIAIYLASVNGRLADTGHWVLDTV